MCRFVATVPDILGLVWPSFCPNSGSKSQISGRILKSFRALFSSAELSGGSPPVILWGSHWPGVWVFFFSRLLSWQCVDCLQCSQQCFKILFGGDRRTSPILGRFPLNSAPDGGPGKGSGRGPARFAPIFSPVDQVLSQSVRVFEPLVTALKFGSSFAIGL